MFSYSASPSPVPNIFEVYSRYCEIEFQIEQGAPRDGLTALSKSIESSHALIDDLHMLMDCLDFNAGSHDFSRFYDFVFFVCRENGQRNITVNKALTAWRFVLKGRFPLLDQWCNFIEKYQRHNISEDTWRQLLAFSQGVYEDLDGYDPEGAWPVLIDDFVDHMCRVDNLSCSSVATSSNCKEAGSHHSISDTLRGLKLLPGSKRKCLSIFGTGEGEANRLHHECSGENAFPIFKRSRHTMNMTNNPATHVVNMKSDRHGHTGSSCINNPACGSDCLLKVSNVALNIVNYFHYGNNVESSTC